MLNEVASSDEITLIQLPEVNQEGITQQRIVM